MSERTLMAADASAAAARPGETASRAGQPRSNESSAVSIGPWSLPYSAIVVAAGAITFADMILEHYLAFGTLSNLTPGALLRHLVLPALAVYMLAALRWLKGVAKNGLAELRPSLQVGDVEFDGRVEQIVTTTRRTQLSLLLTSTAIVLILFVALGYPPLIISAVPLNSPAAALLILAAYIVFGWAGLNLVYAAVQEARGLGALAHRPLVINVFDPTNLLAFGHIALMYSLGLAGVVLILLIGYGGPSELDEWAILFLASLATLVALIIPLWGVNRQMRASRYRALVRIHDQLREIDRAILNLSNMSGAEVSELSNRTITLINLRKVIQESPTWPFRDTATVVRAVAVVMAPLIYFTSTELIRAYIFAGK